ncbi:uncharacterized protein IL334_000115 [Kwoniella shivajii]|uniref:Uncharacterized protein n=1 Tax=Kwoniella shivajii TaxID=564305 RepID=A0ABZ1CPD1_9TREE|nr:hypothetical protein IL334_000115 [Kwoniella shivajii]
MKFSLAILAALAASTSVSAIPFRVYALSSEPIPSPDEVTFRPTEPHHDLEHGKEMEDSPIVPIISSMPCHEHAPTSNDKWTSLFEKLGFTRSSRAHDQDREESVHSVREKLLSHIHEMNNQVVPFPEGGSIKSHPINGIAEETNMIESEIENDSERKDGLKWWRKLDENKWIVKSGLQGNWRVPNHDEHPPKTHYHHNHEVKQAEPENNYHHSHRHGHGHGHGHRHVSKTISARLNRALKNLKPVESIALAFVIGAGLGSIIHFFFMIFLLSFRFFKAGCPNKAERRARRAARRQARKAGRTAEGVAPSTQHALEEEEALLPPYQEGNIRLAEEKSEQS